MDKNLVGWKLWKLFAAQHDLRAFPVKLVHLALYVQHLAKSSASISPIDTAIYSIRWAHTLADISPSPTDSSIVKLAVEGSRRSLAKPKSPKEPVSSSDLAQLVADKGGQDASAFDLRLLFICLVAFAGMLRCDELISVRMRDLSFFHDHMALYVPRRKNDKYRQGHTVFIARSGNPTCPVAMSERYIAMLGISDKPSHPLVCGFKRTKRHGLKPTSKPLSYTTVRDIIVKGLSSYKDPSTLGTHSLRAGGASEAASSFVNERCIARQGGWKSTSSKDMYIKDSISSKLSVTRAMNL
ncbi:uncharacterized protein LOC121416849 [Lytechinus variegatus]|uniref:uncharacterized protein LOC121416849 n=1 Tax=Lytechinus variegatus TaxID=7654 RepID=UPI001BB22B62|nr:uncharacterized protein LOC121416849 [Lytechinus variegatus]